MTKYHKNGNICPTYHSAEVKWTTTGEPNYAWVEYAAAVVLAVVLRFLCFG